MLRCHYYHIISKVTLCSLIIITIILGISNLSIVLSINKDIDLDSMSLEYFANTFETIKMFSVILISFLFGYSFAPENDSYSNFIVKICVSKDYFVIMKILLLFLISLIYVIILMFLFYLIPFVVGIIIDLKYICNFLYLLVILNYYGLFSAILVCYYRNIYLLLISILLYIISNAEITDKKIINFIFLVERNNDINSLICLGFIFCLVLGLVVVIIYRILDK